MQKIHRKNAEMYAACVVEKAAHAKRLLEVSAFWIAKAAQKKGIEKLTRHLAEKRSARKRSIAEKTQLLDVVASKRS